jgi:hypothetical protein
MTTLSEIKARAEQATLPHAGPDGFVWRDHLYCGEAGPLKCDRVTQVKCTGLHLCSHLAELEGSE